MHALNPALVILSITGFGHDGPESQRSGYDQILQGEAGLMSLTGSGPDDPQRVGVPIADLLSGMYGAFGTLAALLQRERTGRGQIVRTSLLAALIGVHAFQGTRATVAGEVPQAQGNHHPSIAPYGLFHCRQGQRADQRGQREALELLRVHLRDRRRRGRNSPPTPTGCATARKSSKKSSTPSPISRPSRCSPNSTTPASRPARSAPWTRSTTGNRSTPRGW